jgi:type I restriction enzyme S subunit
MCNWKTTKLEGKIHVKHGFPFKSEYFKEIGELVVLTPGNFFEEGGFKRNAEKDKCYSHTFPNEYLLDKDDLIVAMTEQAEGLLGSTAKIPYSGKFLHNQRLGFISSVCNDIDLDFVYHLFKTKSVREQIRRSSSGSKVKHTSPNRICDVQVQLPPLADQQKIAKVLSTLDAKIELNNRINTELEAMAKLLYDYWFVQFDFPMTAEQATALGQPELEGQPYKASGGKMVFNQTLKRETPEGWEVEKLENIEDQIITGKTPPTADSDNFGGNIPFICIGDVRGNMHVVKTELTLSEQGAQLQNKKFIPQGAICVTCIASPGLVAFATKDSQTNQQLNSIVCRREEHRVFLYFYLIDYFKYASGAKTGNTFANMNKGDFSAIEVIMPSSETLIQFMGKVSSGVSSILNNLQQNQELTELRDWLLPMLMNGQVTVKS